MVKDVKTKEDKWEKMERRGRIDGKRCKDEEGQIERCKDEEGQKGKDVKTKEDKWEKM